jgi:hypothetical protein
MYPHILDRIIAVAHPKALLKLRGTSKSITDRANSLLCRHLKVDLDSIRSRYTSLWLPDGDPHLAAAISLDVDRVYDRANRLLCFPQNLEDEDPMARTLKSFASQFKHLSLVRFRDWHYQAQGCFEALLPRLNKPWLATRIDGGSWSDKPWSCEMKVVLPRARKNELSGCVINLAFNIKNTRMAQTNVAIKLNLDDSLAWQHPTYYILITRYKHTKKHIKDVFEPSPPAMPILLNTLIDALISCPAHIVLVGSEDWDDRWLGRKHTTNDTLVEASAADASLRDRMGWWIRAKAAKKFTTAAAVNTAVANIQFISWAEFKERVPTREVFDLMVDPELWEGGKYIL